MKKLRNYVAASIGFLLLITILAFSIPQTGHGTSVVDGKEVVVINTLAQAVPVTVQGVPSITGTVDIGNTPKVNAQQSGTWNVGIAGTPTVNIGNAPTVGTRPSLQGAFTLLNTIGFPGVRRDLLGPFPPETRVAIGTVGFFNQNQSLQSVNVGVLELIGEDQSSCSAIPFASREAILARIAPGEDRVWSFPYPMVLPAVPPAGPWCLWVRYEGTGNVGNHTLVIGFYVDS